MHVDFNFPLQFWGRNTNFQKILGVGCCIYKINFFLLMSIVYSSDLKRKVKGSNKEYTLGMDF